MIKTNPSVGVWRGGGTPPPAAFVIDAADFNGTTQYLNRGANLTGVADSNLGIISLWFRIDGGDGTGRYLIHGFDAVDGNPGLVCFLRSDNKLEVNGFTGVDLVKAVSHGAYLADTGWHSLVCAWSGAALALHLYVDGTNVLASGGTISATSLPYTAMTNWRIGVDSGANFFWNGALADVYVAPAQYLDVSIEANLKKFIDGNKPVSLGAGGATPTGTAPRILQHLDDAEAVANFATNRGTGGNFTIISGPLATASTSPSD